MTSLTAASGMLIRRPADVVREAFLDPAVTARFWFTDSTGRLEPGAVVTWTWAMYGVSTRVRVKAVEAARILIEWDIDSDPTEVEWTFAPRGEHCFVQVANRLPDGDIAKALDSTGGFSLVMAAAKIWLEHGIAPRIVEDRHPDHHAAGWSAPSP